MKKLMMCAFAVLCSLQAQAAVRYVGNTGLVDDQASAATLTVKSVRTYYWIPSNEAVLEVEVNEDLKNTGCALTDSRNIVSYWLTGSPNAWMAGWQNMLLAAQAQGAKVLFRVNDGVCSTIAGSSFIDLTILTNPAQ